MNFPPVVASRAYSLVVVSLVVKHALSGVSASAAVASESLEHRLNSCGAWA